MGQPQMVYRREYCLERNIQPPTREEAVKAIKWLQGHSTVEGRTVGPFIVCFYKEEYPKLLEWHFGTPLYERRYLSIFVRYCDEINDFCIDQKGDGSERGIWTGGGLLSGPVPTCFLYKEQVNSPP